MPYTLSNEGIILIFKFNKEMTEKDFNELLSIFNKCLTRQKPFAFIVDASESTLAPFTCAIKLVSWMKNNKSDIKKYLIASCLITNYTKLIEIIRWVFKQQPPSSPNIITKNIEEGREYIFKHVNDYYDNEDDNEDD
jgi:hypothetical protein